MRKFSLFCVLVLLATLCGCEEYRDETRFLMDTVANIKADCSPETLSEAFALCEMLEKTLSRTKEGSDVYLLNNSEGFVEVEASTRKIIERAGYYSELSGGKFDITVYAVSSLWDFKNGVVPNRNEIAEALKNIDYQSIEIKGNTISLGGKKIDLGGIAKGYIADEAARYLKEGGATEGIVNFGGDIVSFGKEHKIAIEMPFESSVAAILKVKDRAVVTSGIYQRYIESEGRIYHHIIDPATGYGVDNELAGVTVIGATAFDCDAMATVCSLLGLEEAKKLIEESDMEAVFIDRKGNITYTSGIYSKNGCLRLK